MQAVLPALTVAVLVVVAPAVTFNSSTTKIGPAPLMPPPLYLMLVPAGVLVQVAVLPLLPNALTTRSLGATVVKELVVSEPAAIVPLTSSGVALIPL